MPEEINRILTDSISDLFFTTSPEAEVVLRRSGAEASAIHFVGNGMIDTLVRLLPKAIAPELPHGTPTPKQFALVTLHRPSNVDDEEKLTGILTALEKISRDLKVVFPVHPRTRAKMEAMGWKGTGIEFCDPLGNLEFLWLQQNARLVVTDSGGVQEETTYLQVPCLTLRHNTERPVTVTEGTNVLLGEDLELLQSQVKRILKGEGKTGRIPDLWDGKAGERTAEVLSGLIKKLKN